MSLLDVSPVIPVVVLDDPADAVPVAEALLAGGISIIEVTLRTPSALECLTRIAAEVPAMTVGAGTLKHARAVEAAVGAGAQFLVSPGATPALLDALLDTGLPVLPACSTISEALALRERDVHDLKFFPAEAAGGPAFLAAAAAVLPDVRFCPTGGITLGRAPAYLHLPNVPCVGGSWLTPQDVIAAREWGLITDRARAAVTLRISTPGSA